MKENYRRLFVLLSISLFTYSYAFVRYHLGKHLIENIHIPFVINKSIAWTAGLFFVMTIIPNKKLKDVFLDRRMLGLTAYGLAVIHVLMGLFLLHPDLYPKFFNAGEINITGWLYISLGALALLFFSLPLLASWRNLPNSNNLYRFGKIGVLLVLLHVSSIGLSGWLDFNKWPYYLPPITLLFVFSSIIVWFCTKTFWKK